MNRFQSIVFEYRGKNDTTGVAPLDGNVVLSDSLNLNPSKRLMIKPTSCQMSTRIPNIYSYGTFNNRVLRVKRNIIDAWHTITLDPGVYLTVDQIEAAITSVLAHMGWLFVPTQSAIQIQANTVTDQVYIDLDSTKLSLGGTQICLDLSQSDIATTLGFPVATTLIADGRYSSSKTVKMDSQGTFCDVVCSLSNARVINGQTKKILFSVPLTTMTGLTEYIYPTLGSPTPNIQYTGSHYIGNFAIEFKTYENIPMVWLPGSRVQVIFELQQEL